MKRRLPGSEQPNGLLRQLIERMDAQTDNLTTQYREADFLHGEHPACKWLLQCINKTIVDYLHSHGQRYEVNWQIQSWPNVNQFGDYHDLHNHPHSYLSGTYYVSVPQAQEVLPGRDDRRPGAISFYDPRPQANMNAVRDDPQIEAEYTVHPDNGMLLLWPSFLHHFVHPNLSREPRISISFNAVLNWSDALLPAQT
jgi:uncharacterized protein (TIGR02466 family)